MALRGHSSGPLQMEDGTKRKPQNQRSELLRENPGEEPVTKRSASLTILAQQGLTAPAFLLDGSSQSPYPVLTITGLLNE